jgi:hypothetical protein
MKIFRVNFCAKTCYGSASGQTGPLAEGRLKAAADVVDETLPGIILNGWRPRIKNTIRSNDKDDV